MKCNRDVVEKNSSDLFYLRVGRIEQGSGDGRWERGKTDEEEGRSERASDQYRAGRTGGIANLYLSAFALLSLSPV